MALQKWMLKAAVQKAISFLPLRNRINFWFQKYITGGVRLDPEHLHWKLTHAADHLAYLKRYSRYKVPLCLELGTGWYPIVPIMLYLHGAGKIQTIDLNAHLSKATLSIALEKLLELEATGALHSQFPDILADNWEHLQKLVQKLNELSLQEALATLNIEAITGDARHLLIVDQSVDFICSNNTFEHIYPDVLSGILQEFKRVLKPGGLMSHFIDLSDHFAHFDGSISIYNFLQFSEAQWARIDNAIQPQNRLRWPQYKALYDSLGIPITEASTRPGDPALLETIDISPEWRKFPLEELAISHGYLVSVL